MLEDGRVIGRYCGAKRPEKGLKERIKERIEIEEKIEKKKMASFGGFKPRTSGTSGQIGTTESSKQCISSRHYELGGKPHRATAAFLLNK